MRREAPYYVGPNDPYAVEFNSNFNQEPSQRIFWNKFGNGGQGSNQVGGTGLWAMITHKFPFLNNMFGRMELAPQYGAPGYPDPGFYQVPQQVYTQQLPYYQQYFPGRNVAVTDDAVIVTPPFVPAFPPAAAPVPAPAPPAPAQEQLGYSYNKPQYKLELPHK